MTAYLEKPDSTDFLVRLVASSPEELFQWVSFLQVNPSRVQAGPRVLLDPGEARRAKRAGALLVPSETMSTMNLFQAYFGSPCSPLSAEQWVRQGRPGPSSPLGWMWS